MICIQIGILVIIGQDGCKELDHRGVELQVIGRSEGRVRVMVIGTQREDKVVLLHAGIDVVHYHPEPVFVGLVACGEGGDDGGSEAETHVGGWVVLVNVEYFSEVDSGPLVDGLHELELELEGVVALELADPDLGEGDVVSVEAPGVGVGRVDVLVVAAEASLHLAAGGTPVA